MGNLQIYPVERRTHYVQLQQLETCAVARLERVEQYLKLLLL